MLVEGKHVMTETASSKRRTKSNVSSRRSQNSSRKTPRSAKRKDKSELKTDEKEQDKKDSTLEDKKNDIVDAVKEKTTDDKNDNGIFYLLIVFTVVLAKSTSRQIIFVIQIRL